MARKARLGRVVPAVAAELVAEPVVPGRPLGALEALDRPIDLDLY